MQRAPSPDEVHAVDRHDLPAGKTVAEDRGRPRAVWKKYFIEGDVHWNPAGHALVAEALAKHL